MDDSTVPAEQKARIALMLCRASRVVPFETAKVLARIAFLRRASSLSRSSLGERPVKSGPMASAACLLFAMGMLSFPVRAAVRTTDPRYQGAQIPAQSAGTFPPIPDALWILGLVLIALIVVARRRFK